MRTTISRLLMVCIVGMLQFGTVSAVKAGDSGSSSFDPSQYRLCEPAGWKISSVPSPLFQCELGLNHCAQLGKLVSAIPDEKYREFVKQLKFLPKHITPDSTTLLRGLDGSTRLHHGSDDFMSSFGTDIIYVGERYWELNDFAKEILLVFESGKNLYVGKRFYEGRPPSSIRSCLKTVTADEGDGPSINGLGALSLNFGGLRAPK